MRLNKTLTAAFLSMLTPAVLFAQPPATKASGSLGTPGIIMITIAIILAFVIFALGQVLLALGRETLRKNKTNSLAPVVITVLLTLSSSLAHAQETVTEVAAAVPNNYGGLGATGFWILFSVIALEAVIIFFMTFSVKRLQAELTPQTSKKTFNFRKWWLTVDRKLFTKAVAVEKEHDIELDHDYDGIKELDNSLPPWWKYGFYITIVFSAIYMLNYHVWGYGKNPEQEYETELARAEEKKAIYEAKNVNKIDEQNLQMPAAGGIADGKKLYETACWPCHGKLGEGGAGPNLTDDYWMHKGSLTDIYKSIKIGYPDRGMQSWEKNYSPQEIANISGYIKTLRGTNPPNAKPGQGDVYIDSNQNDSTALPVKQATL